jgi:hypothetical protein
MTPGSGVDVSFVSVSDPGVPPVKHVIAPADNLMPLAHRPPDIPARICLCNHS